MKEPSVATGWKRNIGRYWAGVKIELSMQLRRWEVWCIFLAISLIIAILLVLEFENYPSILRERDPTELALVFSREQIQLSTWLLVLASGLLVADRIPRDRTLKMIEMNASTLPHAGSYIFGKYWGNLLVLGGAALFVTMFAAIVQVSVGVPPLLLLRVFFAFWYVLVPVLLSSVAFNLLLSCIFSVRVTQILFPIIWLYSTYTPLGMATPANTVLAPDGRYALQIVYEGSAQYSPLEIGANLLLLLVMAILWLFLASRLVFSQKHMPFASANSQPRVRTSGFMRLNLALPERLKARIALWAYHLRVSNPFFLLFLSGGFLIVDLLLMQIVRSGANYQIREFANYVLETGVPLLAGILTSSTLMGDPVREMLVCNRQGLRCIIVVRLFLSLILLVVFATTFLFLSRVLGVHYTDPEREESLTLLFALWLIPTFLASTIGFLGAIFTRSSALGGAIVGFFLLLPHFARTIIMQNPFLQLFTVPLTLFDPKSTLWWQNRLTLLAVGSILLLPGLWWARKEERLIESHF